MATCGGFQTEWPAPSATVTAAAPQGTPTPQLGPVAVVVTVKTMRWPPV